MAMKFMNVPGVSPMFFLDNLGAKSAKFLAFCTPLFLAQVIWAISVQGSEGNWFDSYYQYRIPLVLEVGRAGWTQIAIEESNLTDAINAIEEYSFNPLFLAYNHLKVVEVDTAGRVIDPDPGVGFYLIPEGEELLKSDSSLPMPTENGEYYLVQFVSEGGKVPPTNAYEQTFPVGELSRTHAYMSSYMPRLLPKKRTHHECLLQSDGGAMQLQVESGAISDGNLSVRKARILFLGNFKEPGKKNLMLYYQPLDAWYLKIPEMRHHQIPKVPPVRVKIGLAEKYIGASRYGLGSNADYQLWFADTTVKLTPNTSVPARKSSKGIHVTLAANELQSFQVVIAPKRSFDFQSIQVSALARDNGNNRLNDIDIRAIEYVPVTKKALLNQIEFFGRIGDPLVPVMSRRIIADDGNVGFWVTIRVPPGTPSGTYQGKLAIQAKDASSITVPLVVEVYGFELPEYSTFHTHMGGQFLAKNSGFEDLKTIMQYHGLTTKSELKKLARKYYDEMAVNKFYPKSVVLFTEIGMKWSPPPHGYNVDKPGNYFKLYDWDFTEFNNDLRHYIDDLKVNSVCLTHTNPGVCHVFKHLPGDELEQWEPDPGHVTMGWQTFRQTTKVTWKKRLGDAYYNESIEVTQKQWDRLLLDYYRTIARNLEKHGWLDKFYILGDETSGTENLLHLIRLLKSDPLTSKIRFVQCLQGLEWLTHQENSEYVFTKWFTYAPQLDENYNRWEAYFWDDYNVPRSRDNLWSYAAYCSRLSINAPGMTNRQIGLDMFNRGGSGYIIWDTFMWWHTYGKDDDPHNPWVEPYSRLANGALSYFYPPYREGLAPDPDFTITPSLRVMTYRESVDDYEYARILEELIVEADRRGIDTSAGKDVINDISRMFPESGQLTLNDAWCLDLRDRIARQIVHLKQQL